MMLRNGKNTEMYARAYKFDKFRVALINTIAYCIGILDELTADEIVDKIEQCCIEHKARFDHPFVLHTLEQFGMRMHMEWLISG